MSEELKKIIILVAAILLVMAAVVGGVWLTLKLVDTDGPTDAQLAEYERELSDLVHQKQTLVAEIERIEKDILSEIGYGAYMSFIFVDLDSALYDAIYPVLREGASPLVGVMAFSPQELPGLEGNITLEEYNELIARGWGTAIYWDGEDELPAYLRETLELLDGLGIPHPTSIVFNKDAYRSDYDAMLLEHGLVNVLHNGDGDNDIHEMSIPDGIWYPGYIGWNNKNKYSGSVRLKGAIEENGGYAAFVLTFEEIEGSYLWRTAYHPTGEDNEAKDAASFKRMVDRFKASVSSGIINVSTVDEAREGRISYGALYDNRVELGKIRRSELEARIDVIDRLMVELYDKYFEMED